MDLRLTESSGNLDTLNYIGIGIKKLNINEDKIEQKFVKNVNDKVDKFHDCLLYTSPSPRDSCASRMPSSA